LPPDLEADVALTVNVIEHTADPLSFLLSLRRRIAADGRLVLVCPDGAQADVELLVADHVHSFSRQHLERLLHRAGFGVCAWTAAPDALGAFQMVVARLDNGLPALPPLVPEADIVGRKTAYLERWSVLDERLLTRAGTGPLACFGMGETAGLLRAYAPRVWRQVRVCTADVLPAPGFANVPAIALAEVPADHTVLLAVHPRDQARVATRLGQRFRAVVAWYDLVSDRP
jgi:hypothetical protein